MKIRNDFVTNSSSSSFILSKESLERGLKKYYYPAVADKLAEEGRLTEEVLYVLLHEIHNSFCDIIREVVTSLGISREMIEQRMKRSSRESLFYIHELNQALEDLIEEKVKLQSGKTLVRDELDKLFGVEVCSIITLLDRLSLFDQGWRDCKSYVEFLQKEASDGDLENLQMLLVDHSKNDIWQDFNIDYDDAVYCVKTAMKDFLKKDWKQWHCRFGKKDVKDCFQCPDMSHLCIGEVGLYSWDSCFPYEITGRLMEFCEFGDNHHG